MRYVAFLRALNVGGHHIVKMDELRRHFEALKLAKVETFIASGNVVFETTARDRAALERKIEAHLLKALGHEVRTFLRTDAEVAEIAAREPFAGIDAGPPLAMNVGFLAEAPGRDAKSKLAKIETPLDRFAAVGTELWWRSEARQSDSKISGAVLERALGQKLTFRGLNTVQRLAAKYPPALGRVQR